MRPEGFSSIGSEGMKIYCNAQMTNRHIKKFCQIDEASQKLLEMAIDKFGLSARAYTRILKVARTIADLEGQENIQTRPSLRSHPVPNPGQESDCIGSLSIS